MDATLETEAQVRESAVQVFDITPFEGPRRWAPPALPWVEWIGIGLLITIALSVLAMLWVMGTVLSLIDQAL